MKGFDSSVRLVFEPLPPQGGSGMNIPLPGEGDWNDLPPVGPALSMSLKSAVTEGHARPSSDPGGRIVGAGGMVIDGDVLGCPCPDCKALIPIRLWLMVADCWRCKASIELTEQQEREATRLIKQRDQARRNTTGNGRTAPAPAAIRSISAPPREDAAPSRAVPPPTPAQRRAPAESPPRVATAEQPIGTRKKARATAAVGSTDVFLREAFRDLPAWLISLLLHMALLVILGLIPSPEQHKVERLTLSTQLNTKDALGGEKVRDPNTDEEIIIDLPIPKKPRTDEERRRIIKADQDARELRLDPNQPYPNLPTMDAKIRQINSGRAAGGLAARDPRVRRQMVTAEGGTTLTEAAVARGLRYMAKVQNKDGSWSFRGERGATGLALMAFLGAGQTSDVGFYKDEVSKGVGYLLKLQKPNGDLSGKTSSNQRMYIHAQAAIALCELFAMVGDESLREPAQRSVDFIVKSQYADGGWRYDPNARKQRGDTSVVGWQLMALHSAKLATLDVPETTFNNVEDFLDTVQKAKDSRGRAVTVGSRYAYQFNRPPTHVMTAEALLCRQYLGWSDSHPGFDSAARYLLKSHPPQRSAPEMYYWYYATQMLHHLGGEHWRQWNEKMRDVLVNTQEPAGRHEGSWPVRGGHSAAGGRLYMTALAVCCLEVYYRHLPIYRKVTVE